MRAEELKYLKGDCSKIKEILKWNPEISFEEMIDETINYWKKII
jgi:nucleoside-diphosphate-sugar epimerase